MRPSADLSAADDNTSAGGNLLNDTIGECIDSSIGRGRDVILLYCRQHSNNKIRNGPQPILDTNGITDHSPHTHGGWLQTADGEDDRFAYQLMGGATYHLTDSVALTVRYTYVDTTGDKVEVFNGNSGDVDVEIPYDNHSVSGGVRVGF